MPIRRIPLSHLVSLLALTLPAHAGVEAKPPSGGASAATPAPASASADAPEVDLRLLRSAAQDYIGFRRGRLSARRKLSYVAECLAHPGDNVYCAFVPEIRRQARAGVGDAPDAASSPEAAPNEKAPTRRVDPFQVAEWLERAELGKLGELTETQLHRALRNFPNWDPLQKVADAATQASSCPAPAILTALAQKAEEFFPDEKYRQLALGLYGRSGACGDDEAAKKARYRGALLEIWAGQCHRAEPGLTKLADEPGGDYVSRALFWRAFCARAEGRKMVASALRNRLYKENPLSYHGLLLSENRPAKVARLMALTEPAMQTRSQSRPEFNTSILAVEMLRSLKAHDLALDALNALAERMDQAELPFRLYAAMLMNQSGGSVGQFKLLSSVFREDPAAISKNTLELFYPLRRFEILKRQSARTGMDPYLIAALIRQESGFNERARSPVGAVGLMQLMPRTARTLARVSTRQLYNPATNVKLGVKFFRRLLARFDNDAELALAAYNAGPEKVDEWKRRYPTDNRVLFLDLIPYRETRNYVALIARNYFWYRSLYGEDQPARRGSALFSLGGAHSRSM
jgi:soluble lytic murein transglycosylase